jgi:Tic22-like family
MASRRQAWFRPLGLTLGRPLCAAGLISSAALAALLHGAPAAQAIPEADAIQKLQVVPVFVLTDAKGVPLPIPREKNLVLPLYLESAKANKELASLQKSNPTLKAQVVAIPLNVMNTKVNELNQQLKDKSKPLVAPIVVNEGDRQQAATLLKAQGLTQQQIDEGLNVPVFFTKPFLTVNTPNGPRGVFYLSYETLQNSLAKMPAGDRDKLKPQVADLTAVLREIIKAKDDNYIIFPTPEYFRLVQENQKSGAAGKPAK